MEHPLLKLLSETDNSSVLYQEIVILYLKDESNCICSYMQKIRGMQGKIN